MGFFFTSKEENINYPRKWTGSYSFTASSSPSCLQKTNPPCFSPAKRWLSFHGRHTRHTSLITQRMSRTLSAEHKAFPRQPAPGPLGKLSMGTLGNESFKQNCFIAVPFLRMRKEKSGKTRGLFPHERAEERYSTKKGVSGYSRLQVTLRVSSQEELLWECGRMSVRSWFCLVILWHIFSAWAECNLQPPWRRTNAWLQEATCQDNRDKWKMFRGTSF